MGCECSCLSKKPEDKNEMVNGIIPEQGLEIEKNILNEENNPLNGNNIKTENDYDNKSNLSQEIPFDKMPSDKDIIKTGPSRNNYKKIISYDSSLISKIQNQTESIFDYFNDLRTEPDNYERDAEAYGFSNIIQKIKNSDIPCNNLIINSFYNLLLSSYINNYFEEKNDELLIKAIENEEKFNNFNKNLFSVEADINKPNEVVWKLIEKNKDIAYETFFKNNFEYLIISCHQIPDNENFKCYFLLLSKKNNV